MSESDRQSDAMSDDVKPWTIKNIPPEERNAAIAAADRDGLTIGEWLRRAIREKVQSDRQKDRAPAPVLPMSAPASDLSDIERMIAMAEQLARVSGGSVPKSVSRPAFAILRDRLRVVQRSGRTSAAESQTAETPRQTGEGAK